MSTPMAIPIALASFEMTLLFTNAYGPLLIQFATEEEAHAASDEIRAARLHEFCRLRGMFNTVIFPRENFAALSIVDVKLTHEQQRMNHVYSAVKTHEVEQEVKQRISEIAGQQTGFGIGDNR